MSSLIAYDSRHIQALAAVATLSLCLPPPGIDKSPASRSSHTSNV